MTDVMAFPKSVDEFMEQYKLVDEDHVYSNGTAFVPIFRMKQWFEHLQALPITNADRIRTMTDEELAAWLEKIAPCFDCFDCRFNTKCNWNHQVEKIDWLEQEAKDDL